MKKLKYFAARKPLAERPEFEYYPTPKSLVWELLKVEEFPKEIWEPACGEHAISEALEAAGHIVKSTDIRSGTDFLTTQEKVPCIVTNPPFNLWDEFVRKAKQSCDRFAFLGKITLLAAHRRHKNGIWTGLKRLLVFDRQIDYHAPKRDDGLFHKGYLATGWFVWDMSWEEPWWRTQLLDVNKYCTLPYITSERAAPREESRAVRPGFSSLSKENRSGPCRGSGPECQGPPP